MQHFSYSKTGGYHIANGIENQDAVYYSETVNAIFIAVADGVSQCVNSRAGADIACRAAADVILNETDYIFASEKNRIAYIILSFIKNAVSAEAEKLGASPDDFASTLCFFCANRRTKEIMTFVLGDSRIYLCSDDKITALETSESFDGNRCCTTMTNGAESQVKIEFTDAVNMDSVILCTDGAWKLMYDKGDMPEELIKAIGAKDENALRMFFESRTSDDDCSFIFAAK